MIVVSFFAPRFTMWEGVDYDECLDVLQASCDRLKLRHVCISDQPRPRVETFLCKLPGNLMQAFLDGQRQWLERTREPTLFTGADCILTRDPSDICAGYDIGITSKRYGHINTGAVWCMTKACIPVWQTALDLKPVEWGEDQVRLMDAIRKHPVQMRELPMVDYNAKPKSETDRLNAPPLIVHFKGSSRTKQMQRPWWENFQRATA